MSFALLLAAADDAAPDPMKLNFWVAGTALVVFGIGQRLTDLDVLEAGERHDVPGGGLFDPMVVLVQEG